MAARFETRNRRREYGLGPLVVAALVGAVFGGLSVLVVANWYSLFAVEPTGAIRSLALAMALLFAFVLGSNLWARAEARKLDRELGDKIAKGLAASDAARQYAMTIRDSLPEAGVSRPGVTDRRDE